MSKPDLSKQTTEEWLADYDGTCQVSKPQTSQVIDLRPKTELDGLIARVRNTGITSIRHVNDGLLINTDSYLTNELNNKILKNLNQLASIAEPETGESLYIYSGYRTLFSKKKACIAIEFKEIYTGASAERYFNINLRNSNGTSFKTGDNCEFRIVGNYKRPRERSFIKLWMDSVKQIPDNRPSHIHRYVNTNLSGMVVSCAEPIPHHGITKLTKVKYEGHQYKFS